MTAQQSPIVRRGPSPAGRWVLAFLLVVSFVGAAAIGIRSLPRSSASITDQGRAPEPQTADDLTSQALELIERARVSGDVAQYAPAERAIERALAVAPGDVDALAATAALAAARHRFVRAERLASQVLAQDSEHPIALSILADAQIELGAYRSAFATVDRFVASHPGLASYARAAYALELLGRRGEAIRSWERAIDAARSPSELAFARFHLGELYRTSGRTSLARRAFRDALRADPASILGGHGLARLLADSDSYGSALERYRVLADRQPVPELVTELASLCRLVGDRACVAEQLDLLELQRELLRANGVDATVELITFDLDRGRSARTAIPDLRRRWRSSKNVFLADALAWALHAEGRDREALRYADLALRLGTPDAIFHAHRGSIHRALGDRAAARVDLERALTLVPPPWWERRIRGMLTST